MKEVFLFENQEINNTQLEDEIDKIMEPIEEQYWSYKDEVMKAFDIDDFKESSNYIHKLRKKAESYPEAICKYLTNNFFNILVI